MVVLNLFTKDLQLGETRNGYRAIVFKVIEDLFIAADIVIHSNVYKIRPSPTKEKTYICTSSIEYEVIKIPEQRILGNRMIIFGHKTVVYEELL